MDLAGERLVDSVLERAGATSSAATLKRRSSADIARQVSVPSVCYVHPVGDICQLHAVYHT